MDLKSPERKAAGATAVWVVWWEDPEKSWESLCLSAAEAEREYAVRTADHLIEHWGKVGKREKQTLLAWLDGHLRSAPGNSAEEFVKPAREFLRKVSAGEAGPVIVRTW
jgi:hypothetical protein